MIKVLMLPHPSKINQGLTDGISQVVMAYARYLPDFGIDLVDLEAESYDLIAAHAGLTGPTCTVCHCHGLYWTADHDSPDWEYRVNQRVIEALRHAKEITVPSAWVGETLKRDMRVSPHVIPHGITWQDWQHNEPLSDIILYNKNRQGDVCDASPTIDLARRFPKAHFVNTFVPHKTSPPNNMNVIGLIPHDQMQKLVQSALIYLATTKETWGIGILEAMASGAPILGYAHGGILDLVQHGVNGWLARPGDIDDLAEGLAYCIQHRKVLGENGRELARAWTWEAACARVAEVYRQAAIEEPATVGVVIPVFNKTEQELRRAIESVIRQHYQPTQIIVVDDGSTNGLDYAGIVHQFNANPAYMVDYRRQNNSGVAIARNTGIELARTKYICCLDSDDWIAPDFLRVCVQALEADRGLGIAYTGLYYHKPDGSSGVSPWPGQWDYNKQLQRQNQVPTCCVFRREMWERLGGYRQRYAPKGCGAEDAELWLRAGAYGWKAAKVTEEALFNYSWMSGQVTGDPDYKEVDWLLWHPFARDGQHPFASYATPKRYSHPVRAYDQPVVSVIIPVGPGHEREVVNALDSLEAQTFRQWEAIVVWDSDEDIPGQVNLAYPYIRYRSTGKHFKSGLRQWGAGYARNRGAEIARAPFLLFLDADDWLYPEALQKMINAWNARQAIVYTNYVGKAIIEPQNIANLAPNLQHKLYKYDENKQEAVIGYKAFDFDCEQIMLQPQWPSPYVFSNVTALIPKSWHDEIGGFDEVLPSWEDVDYHWRMARTGHCYYHLEEELMVYRYYTGLRRDYGGQINENLVQYLTDKYAKDGDMVGCKGCPGGGRTTKAMTTSAPVAGAFASSPRGGVKLTATPGNDDNFVRVKIVDGKRGSHPITGSTAINPMTGRKFDYGMRSDGDVILVHRDDVYMVDRRSGQQTLRDPRRFQPIEERVVEPPATGPKVTPPPAPIATKAIPDTVSPHRPNWDAIDQVAFVEATRGADLKDLIHTAEEQVPVWGKLITEAAIEAMTEPPDEASDTGKAVIERAFDFQMLPGVNANIASALKALGLESREDVLKFGVEGLTTVRGIGEKKAQKIVEYLSR